jgi:hypothetical protein
MPYGTIKVDTITFTDAGVDKSVSISGLVQNPTFTGNVTATGTISGLIVQAPTVTGTTANFASGVYTTQISGAIVKVPAGTAAAPSIQVGVGASVAPGLYGAGTDLLGISTGGAGRIFIDSTGRLGVGTSSPQHPLQINAAIAQIRLEESSAGAKRLELWIDSSGVANIAANQSSQNIAFQTIGAERLRIDSSGKLLVGRSATEVGLGGSDLLQVAGAINVVSSTNIYSRLLPTSSGLEIIANAYPANLGTTQSIIFKSGTSGGGGPSEIARFTSDGNVGIGTTSPAKLLHIQSGSVSGAARGGSFTKTLFESSDATTSYWEFQAASTATNDILFSKSNTGTYGIVGYDNVNNALRFHANSAERLRIDSSGRLLVGTSAARTLNTVTAALEVEGTSFNGSSISIINNENTANGAFLNFGKSRGASVGSNTIVNSGDNIAHILFYGANGSGTNIAAGIDIQVDGTPGVNDMPGRIMFSTTADGASTPTERLRITNSGNVGIGTSSPGNALHVIGSIQVGSTSDTIYSSNFGNYSSSSDLSLISGSANLLFKTGAANTERARIDTSGNLGIGTNTPTAKLESYFSSTNPSLSSNTGAGLSVYGTSTVRLNFGNYPASPYSSWVQSSDGLGNAWPIALNPLGGNVGIGTSSPLTKLDVRSGVITAGTLESTNGAEILRGYYSGSGALTVLGTEYSSGGPLLGSCVKPSTSAQGAFLSSTGVAGATRGAYVISGNEHKWYIGAAQTVAENSSVTMSEAMRIDSSGRLLVGTSGARSNFFSGALTASFQVEGTTYSNSSLSIVANGATATVNPYAILYLGRTRGTSVGSNTAVGSGDYIGSIVFNGADGTNLVPAAFIEAVVDGTPGANDMPGRLVFSTTADGAASPTERMRISQNGNTLCRTNANNNNATLSVYGESTAGFTDSIVDVVFTASSPNNTTARFALFRDTTTVRAEIRSDGGLANFSANNVNLSDRSVKKDITPASGTWNSLKEWEIVNFRYKDQPEDADLNMGVIAQQVAESCPEVITVFQEAKEATEDQPAQEERLGVKDQQMMWMAIKALQEALERIETLEAKVSALEGN